MLPVFNEEAYLKQCLESLTSQTIKPYEIIVVDNNSTDASVTITRSFKEVTVLKEKLQGITPARNTGFNAARGDIIARCDADSILPPNWIEKIQKNFSEHKKIDALVGLNTSYDLPVKNVKSINKAFVMLMKAITGHFPLYGPSMALTKKMWLMVRESICLDDKLVHEDIDLGMHIYDAGGVIVFDSTFVASFSGRRIKKDPYQFFIEYPTRTVESIRQHRSILLK